MAILSENDSQPAERIRSQDIRALPDAREQADVTRDVSLAG